MASYTRGITIVSGGVINQTSGAGITHITTGVKQFARVSLSLSANAGAGTPSVDVFVNGVNMASALGNVSQGSQAGWVGSLAGEKTGIQMVTFEVPPSSTLTATVDNGVLKGTFVIYGAI